MQPIRTIAFAVGTAILLVTASMAIAQADRTQPAQRPAQQPAGGQPGKKQQSVPPSAVGRAADGSQINQDQQVPYNPNQVQGDGSNIQVPIGQAAPPVTALPPNAGYNNSGGVVDSAALQQEALTGVHYHYHYYGPGAVTQPGFTPGYGQAGYLNPATAPMPTNPDATGPIGPGNPAPMNTLAGEYQNSNNGLVPEGRFGGFGDGGGGVGGQAWSYGGGIGHWNPFAFGGSGYVEGFND
jgi:hypothetical protein